MQTLSKEDIDNIKMAMIQTLTPILNILGRVISVIPITDKGSSIEVPQVDRGEGGNSEEVRGKVYGILREVSIDHRNEVCNKIMMVVGTLSTVSTKIPEKLKKDEERNYEDVVRKIAKCLLIDSKVPTIPDAHDYMNEIRRWVAHFDAGSMPFKKMAELIRVELDNYFK